jgi:hypothetical protein
VRVRFLKRPFVSQPFSIGLALLFVGLQIASLYHGATYGFASHSHAPKTLIVFDTPVLDVFGYDAPDAPDKRSPERFCDLDMYCDKLDKLAFAPTILGDAPGFDLNVYQPGRAALRSAEWQKAVARGPPSFLSS